MVFGVYGRLTLSKTRSTVSGTLKHMDPEAYPQISTGPVMNMVQCCESRIQQSGQLPTHGQACGLLFGDPSARCH